MESIGPGSSDGRVAFGARGRPPAEDVAHRRAWRLTIAFEPRRVELVLLETIDMIVPPSLPDLDRLPGSPFWFDLRDARDRPSWRRAQRHPVRGGVEIPTGDPASPLAYVDAAVDHGEFTLLVPALADARAVVLTEWVVGGDDAPTPSVIARFAVGRGIDRRVIAADRVPPRTVSDALSRYRGTATIRLRGADDTGPVASTHYRVDDGEPQVGRTVTIRAPGRHTLAFWSVDRAGNVEAEQVVTVTIDRPGGRGA